jgi:hypothetical protein
MRKRRRLQDAYRFPGFHPLATVRGMFGDPKVRIVRLVRRRKKRRAGCARKPIERSTISGYGGWAIWRVETRGFTWSWRSDGCAAAGVEW